MKYLLWAGKLGLLVFWLALLAVWSTVVAMPFGWLLAVLAGSILLLHLVTLVLFAPRLEPERNRWTDKLQLLLFGVFHLQPDLPQATTASPLPAGAESEAQTAGSHADQEHAG